MQKKKKKKQSSKLIRCILNPHPQQKSAVLIPTNEEYHETTTKRLEFSIDFVPDFPQLHGANNYNDLLRRAADDGKNYEKEKHLFVVLSGGKAVLSAMPSDERKKTVMVQMMSRRLPQGCYYSTRHFILGSSNGLLLCSPLLLTPTSSDFFVKPEPVFDDFPAIYVVCNPFTKQWLQVPPPPPLLPSSISPHAVNVGFVSDFDSMDRGGGCWFKIVRLPLDLLTPRPPRRSIELQVFSSHSWEWTTVALPPHPWPRSETDAVSSFPWPIWADESKQITVAVTLNRKKKKKSGGPCLCWMLDRTQAIVYDPIENVVDAVIKVIQPPDRGIFPPRIVHLDAMCVSKGRLWAGYLGNGFKLQIYRASGKKWEMVEEFDIRQVYKSRCPAYKFMTMNPDDPRQVYLKSSMWVVLLNLRRKTFTVVGALEGPLTIDRLKGSTIVCDNPLWPTPLPSPFPSSS